ncbi:MAG TPA: hypothetical protein DCW90_11620, partial [Lachnospiraceae bacterium]|nr:hypothetical protein [Lachnospiraceae bacterium]
MMLKKKNFCILIAVILIVIFSASSKVFASEYNFAIQERRKCGYGYVFPVNSTNKYIWKIVGYDTPGDITGKTPNYDIPAYCLKAEKGFFSENGVRSSAIEYDKQYNMKTQKQDIIDASIMSSDSYDKVLWILDNLYLPKDATDEERTAYLTKTGVLSGNTTKSDLTNDDIEVVQQMAIWYFTNGESDNYKNETLPALWVHKDKGNEPRNDTEYASLSDVFDNRTEDTWEGTYRLEDAAQLYSYIIEEAKKITTYEPTFITSENRPVTKVDTTVKIEQSGNNYIVGPYKLQKNNDVPYTLTVGIKNQDNNDISGYKILKSDKTEETSNNINNLIGQEFYISVPKSNNTQVKLTVNIKYDQKQIDLFTVGNAISATQPIAVINKTSDNYNIEATT